MNVTIWHNPACSKSRDVLRVIEAAGYSPTVIPYMKSGWDRAELADLISQAGLTPREIMRKARGPAKELGLLEEGVSDDQILDAMVEHPVLVERPLVRTDKGAALCRPVGRVLDLLDKWPDAPFARSNGKLLIDAQGVPAPDV